MALFFGFSQSVSIVTIHLEGGDCSPDRNTGKASMSDAFEFQKPNQYTA